MNENDRLFLVPGYQFLTYAEIKVKTDKKEKQEIKY